MVLIEQSELGRTVASAESHGDEPRPLAFRVGRYSRSDGDRALERQEEDTLRLCELHGYEDGGWFGVDAESGNVDTRVRQGKDEITPHLAWVMEQIEAAKGKEPDRPVVLVAYMDDRITRDITQKESLRRFLAQWSDTFWHTSEGIVNPSSASDTLVTSIRTASAQHYADVVAEKAERGRKQRLEEGKPVSGWPGFGHVADGDHWRVDPETGPLLRQAVNDVLDGVPMSSIVQQWNDEGVTTTRGGQWRLTTLRKRLESPTIAGILVRSGEEVGPTEYIEPIIDEVTFRRLQRFLSNRKQGRARQGRQLLTGVLVCGKCGSTMNSNVKGKGVRVYACRDCGGVNVDGEKLDDFMSRLLLEALDGAGANEVDDTDERTELLREIARLDAEEAELEEAAEDLPISVLRKRGAALKAARQDVTERLAALEDSNAAERWHVDADAIRKGWDSIGTDRKRQIILDILGRFEVMPGGSGHAASDEVLSSRLRRLAS